MNHWNKVEKIGVDNFNIIDMNNVLGLKSMLSIIAYCVFQD